MHGLSAGLVVPAIAAMSLGLVGRRAMSSRTGRNYSYNSAGNALTAVIMGVIGSYISIRAIFIAAAGLCLPALFSLSQIRPNEIDYRRARNAQPGDDRSKFQSVVDIVKNRKLLFFALSLVLFQFADASLLPLVAQNLGSNGGAPTSLLTSGLIAAPQLVVVLIAPWVGYYSESLGRRPLLATGFVTEAVRALLFAFVSDYTLLFLAQVLGGLTSAIIGVLTVLVITDLTTGTGRFNVTSGFVATLSTIAALRRASPCRVFCSTVLVRCRRLRFMPLLHWRRLPLPGRCWGRPSPQSISTEAIESWEWPHGCTTSRRTRRPGSLRFTRAIPVSEASLATIFSVTPVPRHFTRAPAKVEPEPRLGN